MPIFYLNDNKIQIKDLYDAQASAGAGEYLTTGTATATIKDTAGATVVSGITLTYYAAQGGVAGHYWIGIIEEDAALTVGADYDVVVDFTGSTDRKAQWTKRERVMLRTA